MPDIKPVNMLVTLKPMSRQFPVYSVNESELDQLAVGYSSTHFTLFGIGIGGFITIVITWIAESNASATPLSARAVAIFASATLITFFFSLYCGCEAWRLRRQSGKLIKRIRNENC